MSVKNPDIVSSTDLIRMYVDEQKSYKKIAEELNTYPNRILRQLKRLGVTIRSRQEQGKINSDKGWAAAPMLGKKHNQKTRDKMSSSIAKSWETRDVEKARQTAYNTFRGMTEEDKRLRQKKAGAARLKTAKDGSKLEKFLLGKLMEDGFEPRFHQTNVVGREDMEVDILLPKRHVAIEVDGPTHHLPLWGVGELNERQQNDQTKNALLVGEGYKVIRLKFLDKNYSQAKALKLYNLLIEELKKPDSVGVVYVNYN